MPTWLADKGYNHGFHNEKSRWNRLELITVDSDEFNVISNDDKKYNIDLSEDGDSFVIRLEPVEAGNDVHFSFVLESRHDVDVVAVETSCGCTSEKLEILDRNHFRFNIDIRTAGFGEGQFSKKMTVHYKKVGEELEFTLPFSFTGLIIHKKE